MTKKPGSLKGQLSLEAEVHQLEEKLITYALITSDGSMLDASRILGLRNEKALEFIMRRHTKLRSLVHDKQERERTDTISKRQVVVSLARWKKIRPR